ncbi:hypothetical protein L1987_49126 [Smallanthus sonchifolius]|uniref:Uncharacterized protein n=1 Tax=Smallanthus sonchifolius TaxID=185202 RepID=A0ACB9FVH3_9ASTR|nr:hypothetical protein L1987_49126 [Smallanthus sonchifolius]
MNIQQPNFDYPVTALQPPGFVVPVNPNVKGPGSFGQSLYRQQIPEAGVEQGSLMGYPQSWNVGPNGQPFDPSMLHNPGVARGVGGVVGGVGVLNECVVDVNEDVVVVNEIVGDEAGDVGVVNFG